jgi:hypothetical protein
MTGYERMIAEQREEIERLRGALTKIAMRWPCETAYEMRRVACDALPPQRRPKLPAPPNDLDPTGTESAVISSG